MSLEWLNLLSTSMIGLHISGRVDLTLRLSCLCQVSFLEKTCGSGFITDPSGIIVTSAHVVEDALGKQQAASAKPEAPLRIALQDGRVFEGSILSIDRLAAVNQIARSALDTKEAFRFGFCLNLSDSNPSNVAYHAP